MTGGHPSPLAKEGAATEACWSCYLDAAGFESQHIGLLGRFHQMMVDAYGAQHPVERGSGIRLAYSLVGLHLALDGGWSGVAVRDAHGRMGKPAPWWPRFERPLRLGTVTVADVAAAGVELGPQAFATSLQRWADDVWASWRDQHVAVAQLATDLRLL